MGGLTAGPAAGGRSPGAAEPQLPRAIAIAAMAVMAATIAAGLAIDASGTRLGVPSPPFVGGFRVMAHPILAAAAVLFAAGVALAPRLLSLRPAGFAAVTLPLALVLGLALNAGRSGAGAWTQVFDPRRSFEAPNEYLAGLKALTYGPGFLVDRFAELVPALPVHVAGHPPGLLLSLHWLGITTPAGLAAVCIAAAALAAPLTYAVARGILAEDRARIAGLLMSFSPGVLLFGATSGDAVFMTLGLIAAWPLSRSHDRRAVVAGAAVLAVVSFFAWALVAVGAWAAVLAWRRCGLRRALELSAACGVALLAFYGVLHLATGFDPIGTFRSTESVYRIGVASIRPYEYWLFGSPTAFLFVLGLPITWFALRAARTDAGLAILTVIAVAAVAGFTKAETERIWLFLAPLVCLAAATVLPHRALVPVLALLSVQGLVTGLVWDTVW